MKISIGSVRTATDELETIFEELETFSEELDTFFEELEELSDFTELEELSDFTELEELSGFTELEEVLGFAELDDESFVVLFLLLELDLTTSLELELTSGSTLFTLEESSPQAMKKSNEKTGNRLRIFISKIYHV